MRLVFSLFSLLSLSFVLLLLLSLLLLLLLFNTIGQATSSKELVDENEIRTRT